MVDREIIVPLDWLKWNEVVNTEHIGIMAQNIDEIWMKWNVLFNNQNVQKNFFDFFHQQQSSDILF